MMRRHNDIDGIRVQLLQHLVVVSKAFADTVAIASLLQLIFLQIASTYYLHILHRRKRWSPASYAKSLLTVPRQPEAWLSAIIAGLLSDNLD